MKALLDKASTLHYNSDANKGTGGDSEGNIVKIKTGELLIDCETGSRYSNIFSNLRRRSSAALDFQLNSSISSSTSGDRWKPRYVELVLKGNALYLDIYKLRKPNNKLANSFQVLPDSVVELSDEVDYSSEVMNNILAIHISTIPNLLLGFDTSNPSSRDDWVNAFEKSIRSLSIKPSISEELNSECGLDHSLYLHNEDIGNNDVDTESEISASGAHFSSGNVNKLSGGAMSISELGAFTESSMLDSFREPTVNSEVNTSRNHVPASPFISLKEPIRMRRNFSVGSVAVEVPPFSSSNISSVSQTDPSEESAYIPNNISVSASSSHQSIGINGGAGCSGVDFSSRIHGVQDHTIPSMSTPPVPISRRRTSLLRGSDNTSTAGDSEIVGRFPLYDAITPSADVGQSSLNASNMLEVIQEESDVESKNPSNSNSYIGSPHKKSSPGTQGTKLESIMVSPGIKLVNSEVQANRVDPDDISIMQREVESLVSIKQQLTDELQSKEQFIMQEKKVSDRRVKDLENELKQSKTYIAGLTQLNKQLQESIESHEEKLRFCNDTCVSLEEELAGDKENIAELLKEKMVLLTENEQIRAEMKSKESVVVKAQKVQIEELNDVKNKLQYETEQIKQNYSSSVETCEKLTKQLAAKDAECRFLAQSCKDYECDVAAMKTKLQDTTNELQLYRDRLHDEVRSEIEEEFIRSEALTTQVTDLSAKLESAKAEISSLIESHSDLKGKLNEKRDQLKELEINLLSTQTESDSLREKAIKYETMEGDMLALKGKCSSLEVQLNEAKTLNSHLKAQNEMAVVEKQSELDTTKEQKQALMYKLTQNELAIESKVFRPCSCE